MAGTAGRDAVCTELPAALLDSKNIIMQASGEQNGLCREIRCRKKALPVICGQSQQFMAKMARTQKSSVVEICEAGMAKLVVPVFRDQNYLGSITACGCMLPETEIETVFIEKTTGIVGDAIAEMAEKFRQLKGATSTACRRPFLPTERIMMCLSFPFCLGSKRRGGPGRIS